MRGYGYRGWQQRAAICSSEANSTVRFVFGFGGIYVEVFKDVQTCLCPADRGVVRKKIESLKSYAILKGARGMQPADIDGYVDAIVRVSWLLAEFQEIKELDINPLRLFQDKAGVCALDSRMVIEKG